MEDKLNNKIESEMDKKIEFLSELFKKYNATIDPLEKEHLKKEIASELTRENQVKSEISADDTLTVKPLPSFDDSETEKEPELEPESIEGMGEEGQINLIDEVKDFDWNDFFGVPSTQRAPIDEKLSALDITDSVSQVSGIETSTPNSKPIDEVLSALDIPESAQKVPESTLLNDKAIDETLTAKPLSIEPRLEPVEDFDWNGFFEKPSIQHTSIDEKLSALDITDSEPKISNIEKLGSSKFFEIKPSSKKNDDSLELKTSVEPTVDNSELEVLPADINEYEQMSLFDQLESGPRR